MNRQEHLFVNLLLTAFFIGLLWFIHYLGFSTITLKEFNNLLGDYFEIWIVSLFVFSNLSDIDNANARVSTYFLLFCIGLGGYGVYKIFNSVGDSISLILGIVFLIIAPSLMIYHHTIQIDGWHHRRFPHTFTFGAFTSMLFSSVLLFLGFSLRSVLVFFVISFIYFSAHIFVDGFLDEAIQRDKQFWASNTNGKKDLIFCRY